METSTAFLPDPPLDPSVQAVHDDYIAEGGYVNNYARVWCWRPEVLTAFIKLRSDLTGPSTLTPRELAVLVVATASTLGDSYCSLAWGERLAGLSDGETAAAVVRGDDAELTEREAALGEWARRVVDDPNGTTEADIDRLRAAGFDDREIFEATAWIGFRLAFSTINDALGLKPDREIVDAAPAAVREAVSFGRSPG